MKGKSTLDCVVVIIEHLNMMNMHYEYHAEQNLAIESLKEVIEINLNELYRRALKEECK